MFTDKNRNHPEINYYGSLYEETNTYLSSWGILTEIEDLPEGDIVEIFEGTWEFKVTSSKVK